GLGTTVGYAHLRPRYRVAALRPSTTRSDSAGHRHALLPFALGVAKRSRRGVLRLRACGATLSTNGFLPGSARTGFPPSSARTGFLPGSARTGFLPGSA